MRKLSLIFPLLLLLFFPVNAGAQQRTAWDFTTGVSDETIENFEADDSWTVTYNDDGSFYQAIDASKMYGTLYANDVPIAELSGLIFTETGLSSNGSNFVLRRETEDEPAKFRMTRANSGITFRVVPGQTITIRAKSPNSSAENRGFVGDDNLSYISGPDPYTDGENGGICLGSSVSGANPDSDNYYTLVWQVTGDTDEDSLDVTISCYPAGGLDITSITIEGDSTDDDASDEDLSNDDGLSDSEDTSDDENLSDDEDTLDDVDSIAVSSVATALFLYSKDGSEVTFLLSERPSVTFSGGNLVITSSEADASYPLSDVLMLAFEEVEVNTGTDGDISVEDSTIVEDSTDYDDTSAVASGSSALTIHVTDGSKVTFLLSERPAVTFSDGYLLITSDDADASYPLSDVIKFTFGDIDDEDTGIDSLPVDETTFGYDGGAIVVTGLNSGSTAKVYTIGGMMVHSESISDGSWTYSLSSLSSGIYIININGKSFKISKK